MFTYTQSKLIIESGTKRLTTKIHLVSTWFHSELLNISQILETSELLKSYFVSHFKNPSKVLNNV